MPSPIDFTLNVRLPSFPAHGPQPTTSAGVSTLPTPVTEQWTRLPSKRSHDRTQATFRAAPESTKREHRSKEEVAKSVIAYQAAVTSNSLSALQLASLYEADLTLGKYINQQGKLTFQGEQLINLVAGKEFQPITGVILELWTEKENTLSIVKFADLHGLFYDTFRRLVRSNHTLSNLGEQWLKSKDLRDGLIANNIAPGVAALAKSLEDEVMHIEAPALVGDESNQGSPKPEDATVHAWARELLGLVPEDRNTRPNSHRN